MFQSATHRLGGSLPVDASRQDSDARSSGVPTVERIKTMPTLRDILYLITPIYLGSNSALGREEDLHVNFISVGDDGDRDENLTAESDLGTLGAGMIVVKDEDFTD